MGSGVLARERKRKTAWINSRAKSKLAVSLITCEGPLENVDGRTFLGMKLKKRSWSSSDEDIGREVQ